MVIIYLLVNVIPVPMDVIYVLVPVIVMNVKVVIIYLILNAIHALVNVILSLVVPVVTHVKLDIIFPLQVVAIHALVVPIVIHVKMDIFYIQENASHATKILNRLMMDVNVQIVKMVIIYLNINVFNVVQIVKLAQALLVAVIVAMMDII